MMMMMMIIIIFSFIIIDPRYYYCLYSNRLNFCTLSYKNNEGAWLLILS